MRKWIAGAVLAALLVAGCGGSDDYANDPRPPAQANVSVFVTNSRISVSPARLGAGPAIITVANNSDRSRDITLSPPEGSSSACVDADASSGPINPMGVAHVTVELVEGDCIVSARGGSSRGPTPAHLTVGRERTSAQADLLQP